MSDPSNGYLVDDNCVLGAEIPNFSKLGKVWNSEQFSAGGHKWKINLYPKGNGEATGRSVSVFLQHLGSERVKAPFTVFIKNHENPGGYCKRVSDNLWFSASDNSWGWSSFIEIAEINDSEKRFIVNDSCLLDIEISVQAVAQ
ncbi:hypothetical protein ABFS82_07G097100 [Erythranthe guttata]